MPPLLMKIAQWVSRRPSNATIRWLHSIFGIVIILFLWISQDTSVVDVPFYGEVSPSTERIIEYSFWILGFLLIIRGIVTKCLFKQKIARIIQTVIGFLLILIGGPIMDPVMTTVTPAVAEDTNSIIIPAAPVQDASVHAGALIVLIGIFWMLVGATGKGITQSCIQYGEVVKKIRV